jgi:hypothetical protein
MTITSNPTFRRTAQLGACFLMGAAALTACGNDSQVVAGPGNASSPPAAPAAAYVSPELADRAAMLELQAQHFSPDAISRRPAPYVSPELTDRAAMLELQAQRFSADAIERRAEQAAADAALDRSADLDLTSALAKAAAVQKSSAHASADSIERNASEPTSAHRSADALEHWALSSDQG